MNRADSSHRGGDVTPSRSGVWAGRRLDGHMARFAFEALEIELTEGQPDTSANKANEKKSRTMKKLIAAAGIGAALIAAPLAAAGTASASPQQDSQYVGCVAEGGIYNNLGPSSVATVGRDIAYHISSGIRDPLEEREYVYFNTPNSVSRTGANYMVNCATDIYLGFGPAHGTDINDWAAA